MLTKIEIKNDEFLSDKKVVFVENYGEKMSDVISDFASAPREAWHHLAG